MTCNEGYRLENGVCVVKKPPKKEQNLCRCQSGPEQSSSIFKDYEFECTELSCQFCNAVTTYITEYKIKNKVCVPKTLCEMGTGFPNPKCTKNGQYRITQEDADGNTWCVSKWAGIRLLRTSYSKYLRCRRNCKTARQECRESEVKIDYAKARTSPCWYSLWNSRKRAEEAGKIGLQIADYYEPSCDRRGRYKIRPQKS